MSDRDPAIAAAERAWNGMATADRHSPSRYAEAAASEALAPLRLLHRRDGGGFCWSCDHTSWPCDTARLIYREDEL